MAENEIQDQATEQLAAEPAGEPLGTAGLRALEAERKARREAEKRLRELEARLAEYERREAVYEIAAKHDIPPAWWGRLRGSTREELEADATELRELLEELKPKQADVSRRPKERLRPGAAPDVESQDDLGLLAEKILNS
jgi:hypothetical protein